MDRPLPIVSDDGDLSWSDSHSMDSDDFHGLPHTSWMASLSAHSTSVSASSVVSFAHTGQLSPISNGMDPPAAADDSSGGTSSSSASPTDETMICLPGPAVCADAWSLGYSGPDQLGEVASSNDGHDDIAWEQGSDDILIAAKPEPLDEDEVCLGDFKEAPTSSIDSSHLSAADQQRIKRPRGRPRKHPLTPNVAANKITKGRSKTGCLTCRKRKKKCDEAKPRCMNCEKNAVVCEGYPEKQIWKSGKERAEEERMKCHSLPLIAVQPIFHGLETVEDRIFWRHYNEQLSTVLTVEGEHKNAFKDMMIPIAVKHRGLMHSILSLASKHIDFDTPYGLNILKNHPATTAEALRERSLYHHDQARLKFYDDVEFSHAQPSPDYKMLVSARYGQMLCFLLEALAEGNPRGEHRLHLSGYKSLISSSPPDDGPFLSFIAEFFQYHIFADELIHSVVSSDQPAPKETSPAPQIHPPRLLGVADGLLEYLSQITAIRKTIRGNMATQIDPVVNYQSLYRAADIDVAIREWTPHWPAGDSRENVGLLYKHMVWIHLFRTVYPPSSSASSSMASSAVLLPPMHTSSLGRSTSSTVNTPPQSASTSCASSPRLSSFSSGLLDHSTNGVRPISRPEHPSRKNSTMDGAGGSSNEGRPESPPPIRRSPEQHDPRVTLAVDEALAILEGFKPSDPSQTLLLLPCFVIGTACFAPGQQDRVRAAIKTAKGYTGLRNADRAMEVLEEVWRLMSAGRWSEVWDWPGVARRLGLDFIPA